MDLVLTILFYVYAALGISAPLFVIPAVVISRKLSNATSKGVVAGIPWLGLPLFALMIRRSKESARPAVALDRR